MYEILTLVNKFSVILHLADITGSTGCLENGAVGIVNCFQECVSARVCVCVSVCACLRALARVCVRPLSLCRSSGLVPKCRIHGFLVNN